MQTEFVRSLHANYERILLEEKPEEQRYQYCILNRGGIKGLLPCSLRYMNGLAYLYYDISSKQNVAQLYGRKCIDREWMHNFLWSLKQIQMELERFLLDAKNILWNPEQMFQDVENGIFSFLYIPYYEGEDSFQQLLEFLVEHIDYEDEALVECTYKFYERYEKMGEGYLQEQIFEDAKVLEQKKAVGSEEVVLSVRETENVDNLHMPELESTKNEEIPTDKLEKRGIRCLFEGKRRRGRTEKDSYQRDLQLSMTACGVAEDTVYQSADCEEEYGRTIYVEDTVEDKQRVYRLYTEQGKLITQLDNASYILGKKKGEADIILEDASISRMHARIIKELEGVYLEDLNSTNGTYKNGLRMQPYEKRKLEEGDEIKLGKVILFFR